MTGKSGNAKPAAKNEKAAPAKNADKKKDDKKKEEKKAAPAKQEQPAKKQEQPKKEAPKKEAPKAAAAPAKAVAAPAKKTQAKGNGNGIYVRPWGNLGNDGARAVFGNVGKITDVRLRRGKYALVWFDSNAAAKKAVDSFNNRHVSGRTIKVSLAKATPQADKHTNSKVVFASPLFQQNTTRRQIMDLFKPCGKIEKLRTYRNNYAFVYFESAAAAAKAVKDLNGSTYGNKKLLVKNSVRSRDAEKKETETRKQLIAAHEWKRHH